MYQSVHAAHHTRRTSPNRVVRSFRAARSLVARRRTESGAALVEFALVLPILVTLLLGAVDMGFYLNDTGKLRSAVREAGRRASAGGYGNTTCPSGFGQSAAASYTSGDPRATESSKVLCLAKLFAYESGLDARIATRVVSFDSNGVVQAGRNEAWDSGNALVLCAQITSRSRTGLLGPLLNNRVIQSRVTMRIMNSMANGPGEASEATFGGDWSGCTVTS